MLVEINPICFRANCPKKPILFHQLNKNIMYNNFNSKHITPNGFNYTILKLTKNLDTNNVLITTPKYKQKKYGVLYRTCHKDGSESNLHISYYKTYEEARNSMLSFPSWYDYIAGNAKDLQGSIFKLA